MCRASPISDLLRQTLAQNSGLALRGNSEKARSEYLIAPILAEVYQQTRERANLFSGTEFNVDQNKGLIGFCDFLFSLSPLTIEIEAPVVSVVEAKKEDLLKGIPQCLAELIAAQIFNARADKPIDTLYGAVTTGTDWKFLRLQERQQRLTATFTTSLNRKRLSESFAPCCAKRRERPVERNVPSKPCRGILNYPDLRFPKEPAEWLTTSSQWRSCKRSIR